MELNCGNRGHYGNVKCQCNYRFLVTDLLKFKVLLPRCSKGFSLKHCLIAIVE